MKQEEGLCPICAGSYNHHKCYLCYRKIDEETCINNLGCCNECYNHTQQEEN